ncbi:hypothetical protein SDJN03_00766, partial [Cucurbita argyrosperma subsp. sororia]
MVVREPSLVAAMTAPLTQLRFLHLDQEGNHCIRTLVKQSILLRQYQLQEKLRGLHLQTYQLRKKSPNHPPEDQICTVSEQHNRCSSPISQAVDIQSTRLPSVRRGEMLLLESSSERFPEHFLALKPNPGSTSKKVDNKLHSPVKSIKLFVRTVMVTDDKKPSPHGS